MWRLGIVRTRRGIRVNAKTLGYVEDQCHELLTRIKMMRDDKYSMEFIVGTQYSAAVRRQSMELTRALAALRKSL